MIRFTDAMKRFMSEKMIETLIESGDIHNMTYRTITNGRIYTINVNDIPHEVYVSEDQLSKEKK